MSGLMSREDTTISIVESAVVVREIAAAPMDLTLYARQWHYVGEIWKQLNRCRVDYLKEIGQGSELLNLCIREGVCIGYYVKDHLVLMGALQLHLAIEQYTKDGFCGTISHSLARQWEYYKATPEYAGIEFYIRSDSTKRDKSDGSIHLTTSLESLPFSYTYNWDSRSHVYTGIVFPVYSFLLELCKLSTGIDMLSSLETLDDATMEANSAYVKSVHEQIAALTGIAEEESIGPVLLDRL